MIIDSNMYWFPEELFENDRLLEQFLQEIPEEYGWYGHCEEIVGTDGLKQIVLEKPKGFQNLNYAQHDYILEEQLKDMDAAGVDKAVLKVPCCQEWMSVSMCRYFNNEMHKHAEKSGGRMIPLGIVPPYDTKENMEELIRCYEKLGVRAIQMSAHYGDSYLDDEKFSAFFEKVNELEMTVYVHHTPVPVEYDSFFFFINVRRSYGRCVDQGLAVGRELFSGFFTKYPNIKIIHSMLGGGFFAVSNMMFPKKAKVETINRFKSDNEKVVEQFKNNMFFEMSHAQPWGKSQLLCAIESLGADHIIFGTSYPVRKEWLLEGAGFVKELEITEEEKELILGKNAQSLYAIE